MTYIKDVEDTNDRYPRHPDLFLCTCSTCVAYREGVKIAAQKLADAVDEEIIKKILRNKGVIL